MAEFRVLREHLGDRMYFSGESRDAEPGEVAHLVRQGVLEAIRPAKVAGKAPPARKSHGAAPENKSK